METRTETEDKFVEMECCIPVCLCLPRSLHEKIAADVHAAWDGKLSVEQYLQDYLSDCEYRIEEFAEDVVEMLREEFDDEQGEADE